AAGLVAATGASAGRLGGVVGGGADGRDAGAGTSATPSLAVRAGRRPTSRCGSRCLAGGVSAPGVALLRSAVIGAAEAGRAVPPPRLPDSTTRPASATSVLRNSSG